MTVPVIAVVALAVSLAATPVVITVARRTGWMDRPGNLKVHHDPVPYLGGVAVFAGTAVGVLSGRPSVLIALGAALALGLADDRWDLPPSGRLAAEVVIGVLVVVTCPVHLVGWAAAVSLVVATVLVINGVNLLDGLDLLAAGVALVAALGFAVLVDGPARDVAVALAAALAGFSAFNRPPARIYLGDGGAYLVGAALVVLVAGSWTPHRPDASGVAALALVALPVAELACAIVRRLRGRRSLMAGDRGHPYDRLVTRGWPRPSASLAYIVVQALLTAAAVAVGRHGSVGAAITVDVVAAVVLVALAALAGGLTPDREASS